MHWDDVLQEVLNRKDSTVRTKQKKSAVTEKYYLGEPCEGIYLTQREAETMAHIILGKTIHATGEAMGLSPRTVEFYLNNIKYKLHCRTRTDLISKVLNSGFMENLSDGIKKPSGKQC